MGTELGINAFCPIICERSSVREQFRTDKWRRWSVEACKQCGGNILPRIDDVQDFKSLLDTVGAYDFAIFGDMQGQQCDWKAEIGRSRKILIFVGPEGGFTDGEVDQMRKAGVAGMRIGPHVLRIETAGVALTSAVQFSAR
jgi:16S rRNA (uracil1498-N3)-methyltransferase